MPTPIPSQQSPDLPATARSLNTKKTSKLDFRDVGIMHDVLLRITTPFSDKDEDFRNCLENSYPKNQFTALVNGIKITLIKNSVSQENQNTQLPNQSVPSKDNHSAISSKIEKSTSQVPPSEPEQNTESKVNTQNPDNLADKLADKLDSGQLSLPSFAKDLIDKNQPIYFTCQFDTQYFIPQDTRIQKIWGSVIDNELQKIASKKKTLKT